MATPFAAVTLVEMPEGVDVKDTLADEVVTTLPAASRTWTTTFAMVLPLVEFTGCVEKLNWEAAPGEIVNELLVALVSPELAAVRV